MNEQTSGTPPQVTRLEVISDTGGRELVLDKGYPFTVEMDVQDDGRTVKIFLKEVKAK